MLLYLIGRDASMIVTAFGWSLLINAVWALCWVLGKWGAR